MRDVTFSEGQIAMVTKVVYGVEDGPTELHFLVRPLALFLASSWVLTPANGQDLGRFLIKHNLHCTNKSTCSSKKCPSMLLLLGSR